MNWSAICAVAAAQMVKETKVDATRIESEFRVMEPEDYDCFDDAAEAVIQDLEEQLGRELTDDEHHSVNEFAETWFEANR